MAERLGKQDFIDRVRRNVIGEWHINQSPLSLKKLASLMRCTETNIYVRSRDKQIIEALNKSDIHLTDVNNLKSFVYQAKKL
ncbi:hypothetical protein [Cytobacillus horneckiae]|uniref:Uncharacterized protein n=1 Tax=Cytobacillus horneckiae TaxID=549687 RepID=A0A2N0ZMB8_9BACI|nr:hypothetical protein [Cytobacillus horneckiae]MEC1155027.1 hypothetical protein [Cytobacillus horneckiae]MED2936067.1 hypothetical protein [Cytobacillus horneckiae]PKG30659.1 hypothetical protein CWS20_01870 [Cytobacillus horneckiae]